MVCHLLDEVGMLALLHDAALLHHQDVVGIHDRAAAHTPHTQRETYASAAAFAWFPVNQAWAPCSLASHRLGTPLRDRGGWDSCPQRGDWLVNGVVT